jgi:hypothetical protein
VQVTAVRTPRPSPWVSQRTSSTASWIPKAWWATPAGISAAPWATRIVSASFGHMVQTGGLRRGSPSRRPFS